MAISIATSNRCVAGVLAAVLSLVPLACRRVAGQEGRDVDSVASVLQLVLDADSDAASQCLATIRRGIQTGQWSTEQRAALRDRLRPLVKQVLARGTSDALYWPMVQLDALWNDSASVDVVRRTLADESAPWERRTEAVDVLVAIKNPKLLGDISRALDRIDNTPPEWASAMLAALGRCEDPAVADVLLPRLEHLRPDLQLRAVELLTQRPVWARSLVAAVAQGRLAASLVNGNQVRRMVTSGDAELAREATRIWGAVRTERSPERERVVAHMRDLVRTMPGNASRGQVVFDRVCGQCHRMHGRGQDVGPDLTSNGRSSLEQLLSNVFDPSLVIGPSYQAQTILTTDGRVLTGLVVEDDSQRVVLKLQGGKQETIPRDQIDDSRTSPLSLMPEGLENQLSRDEIADLFAYLLADAAPH